MKEQLVVASLQMEQQQKDIDANIAKVKQLVKGQAFDLLVLPEMWTTGFLVKVADLSREFLTEAFERGLETMKALATANDAALYGTLLELRPSGKPSNTGLFVTPGEVTYYRKKHLFHLGGEAEHFEAGEERVQVEYHGWQIRLSICYDLRFPTWLRQDPQLGLYHLLLCSANWPRPRHLAWERLLRARAIENQCYLVASNRAGIPHPKLIYPGYSFIIDSEGESLAESKEPVETLLSACICRSDLEAKRQTFPVLEDLDPYQLLQI